MSTLKSEEGVYPAPLLTEQIDRIALVVATALLYLLFCVSKKWCWVY